MKKSHETEPICDVKKTKFLAKKFHARTIGGPLGTLTTPLSLQ